MLEALLYPITGLLSECIALHNTWLPYRSTLFDMEMASSGEDIVNMVLKPSF